MERAMVDQSRDVRDDISFMRSLVEAGRNKPIMGGSILAAGGATYTAAALLNWLIEIRGLASFWTSSAIWWGASAIFLVVHRILVARMRTSSSIPGTASFAFGIAWIGSGIACIASVVIASILFLRFHDPIVFAQLGPTLFCFYGMAWFTSSALARQYWMLVVAIASFATGLLIALLPPSPSQPLVYALAIVCLTVVPGVYLMQREPH
jgi:hypothetical protein